MAAVTPKVTPVIMPALEMAQDFGRVIRWLKAAGEPVTKGEALMEIETDKITVEIEAPATGWLRQVMAQAGELVPVGQKIAEIDPQATVPATSPQPLAAPARVRVSPVAQQIANAKGIDLA